MKFIFIHHVADLYGASRSLLRLSTALVKDGHTVHVILQESGPLKDALEKAGVNVTVLSCMPVLHRSRLTSLGAIFKLIGDAKRMKRELMDIIRSVQPDVIHSNSATTLPVAGICAKKCSIPHVMHIREFFEEFGILWKIYRSVLLRYTDLILCVSSSVARQFPANAHVAVLHNGFPASEFSGPDPEGVRTFRETYAPRCERLVGVIGRIIFKRKGQETFVQSAIELAGKHPDTGFMIIGGTFPGNEDNEAKLRQMISDSDLNDRIILTGEILNLKDVFSALDIIVMSSGKPEPFGGVVIEAMAHGKPVVGTDIGGTPEQIEDGKTGILVPPNDPRAMADALDTLLRDPKLAKSMGRDARSRFLEHFEFDRFYETILAHYKKLIH